MRTCLFLLAVFLILVPPAIGLGLGVVIYGLADNGSAQVLKNGTVTDGEVTSVSEDMSTTVNDEHPFNVEFKYTVDDTEKTGKDDVWKKRDSDITVGEKVGVKYLGDKAVLTDFKRVDLSWLALFPMIFALPVAFGGFVLFIVAFFVGGKRV